MIEFFLTAYTGYGLDAADPGNRDDLRLHVICLSLGDGNILWDKEIEPAPEEQEARGQMADHGYASPDAMRR